MERPQTPESLHGSPTKKLFPRSPGGFSTVSLDENTLRRLDTFKAPTRALSRTLPANRLQQTMQLQPTGPTRDRPTQLHYELMRYQNPFVMRTMFTKTEEREATVKRGGYYEDPYEQPRMVGPISAYPAASPRQPSRHYHDLPERPHTTGGVSASSTKSYYANYQGKLYKKSMHSTQTGFDKPHAPRELTAMEARARTPSGREKRSCELEFEKYHGMPPPPRTPGRQPVVYAYHPTRSYTLGGNTRMSTIQRM